MFLQLTGIKFSLLTTTCAIWQRKMSFHCQNHTTSYGTLCQKFSSEESQTKGVSCQIQSTGFERNSSSLQHRSMYNNYIQFIIIHPCMIMAVLVLAACSAGIINCSLGMVVLGQEVRYTIYWVVSTHLFFLCTLYMYHSICVS